MDTFDEAFQLASKADILDVQVTFLHINHLIRLKKHPIVLRIKLM